MAESETTVIQKERVELSSILAILEKHNDELVSLLGQRIEALVSSEYVETDIAELEHRIDAHLDGLLVHPAASFPLLADGIASDDPEQVYASAYALLRMKSEKATGCVVEALRDPESSEKLSALHRALHESPGHRVPLKSLLDTAPPDAASAIMISLAANETTIGRRQQVEQFIASETPEMRVRAWQIVALLGRDHAI